jgi:superfamily II DNA/RNA helicase
MSSRAELKAKSVKRFQKKTLRSLKRKRGGNKTDEDSDNELEDAGFIGTPAELREVENKASKNSEKKMKKKHDNGESNLEHGFSYRLPPASYTITDIIEKNLWNGVEGSNNPSDELKSQRKDLGIVIRGNLLGCPPPVTDVQDENLPALFRSVLSHFRIVRPTPIQMQCWPAVLSGTNVLSISPTGSGKTLGYALPLAAHVLAQLELTHIRKHESRASNCRAKYPIALVLVPTRELALQVAAVLKPLKRSCGLSSAAVYGGQDRTEQFDNMGQKLDVLVATPGRLLDYISNAKLVSLALSSFLVIDEADRMLAMGFYEQINAVSTLVRPDRQIVMFSATFPGKLREISSQWLQDAAIIRCNTLEYKSVADLQKHHLGSAVAVVPNEDHAEMNEVAAQATTESVSKNLSDLSTSAAVDDSVPCNHASLAVGTVEGVATVALTSDVLSAEIASTFLSVSALVTQDVHVCVSHKKPRLVLRYITRARNNEKAENLRQPGAMIIFCNKIVSVKFVHTFLNKHGVSCEIMHGQLDQAARESVLNNFKAVSRENS